MSSTINNNCINSSTTKRRSNNSNWDNIWNNYKKNMNRIDELEKHIDESIRRKRRRLSNILDETKSYRSSRLRLFVTHSSSKTTNSLTQPHLNGKINWKLLIEGKLLIGHLDYKSCLQIEREAAKQSGLHSNLIEKAALTSISDNTTTNTTNANTTSTNIHGISGSGINSASYPTTTTTPSTYADAAEIDPRLMIRSTDRTEYRGISEKEGDVSIDPIKFTHFFNKIEISFQTIYKPKTIVPPHNNQDAPGGASFASSSSMITDIPPPKKKTKKSRSGKFKPPSSSSPADLEQQKARKAAIEEEKQHRLLTISPLKTKVVWTRQNTNNTTTTTPDSNAFVVNYTSTTPTKDDNKDIHSVVAMISLYTRSTPKTSSTSSTNPFAGTVDPYASSSSSGGMPTTTTTTATSSTPASIEEEVKYIISPTLASALFPDHIDETTRKKKEDDAVAAAASSSSKKKKSKKQQQEQQDSAAIRDMKTTVNGVPIENDILIQPTLSLKEIVSGIYTYVITNQLLASQQQQQQQQQDNTNNSGSGGGDGSTSGGVNNEGGGGNEEQQGGNAANSSNDSSGANSMIIKCDTVLTNLFSREQISFSEIQQLLFEKELISIQNTSTTQPILLTYIMKENEGSKFINDIFFNNNNNNNSNSNSNNTINTSMASMTTTTAAAAATATNDDHNQSSQVVDVSSSSSAAASQKQHQQEQEQQHSNMLSLDIDVNVPGLFHYRTRELMRRIKRREFEYTSSRTKARNMLVATHANEDIVKSRIEEVVSGRGYANEHIPIWLALAKSAPAGSEARESAFIDARICSLLDRLDHHCRAAKVAHGVVDACNFQQQQQQQQQQQH